MCDYERGPAFVFHGVSLVIVILNHVFPSVRDARVVEEVVFVKLVLDLV